MKILLTNDDGIYAEGLWALYRRFRQNPENQVEVVAPDRERSAIGHAITLHNPLRLQAVTVNGGYQGYAVNGTPADCVKVAILSKKVFGGKRPALVISGINPGANLGNNLNYSGTVAAAREAALNRIPAISVSVRAYANDPARDYDGIADFACKLARKIQESPLPTGNFLNVNFPNKPVKDIPEVRLSRQGVHLLTECLDERTDPRDREYFWFSKEQGPEELEPHLDLGALSQDAISVTPVKCDMTDYELLEALKDWDMGPNPRECGNGSSGKGEKSA